MKNFSQVKIKSDNSQNCILIEDRIDLLSSDEEAEMIKLFNNVYDKSGMPITLYTDDFKWKDYYDSLAIYSEELYYEIGLDEDAMIILFTAQETDGFLDWEYDMYCGEYTIKCFSDKAFDELLDKFQKSMSSKDLSFALTYSWNSVINDLAKTTIDAKIILVWMILALFFGGIYSAILADTLRNNAAYKYFLKNPDKLLKNTSGYEASSFGKNDETANWQNVKCPMCNEINSTQNTFCKFCGYALKQ